jgi:hypothetical protein
MSDPSRLCLLYVTNRTARLTVTDSPSASVHRDRDHHGPLGSIFASHWLDRSSPLPPLHTTRPPWMDSESEHCENNNGPAALAPALRPEGAFGRPFINKAEYPASARSLHLPATPCQPSRPSKAPREHTVSWPLPLSSRLSLTPAPPGMLRCAKEVKSGRRNAENDEVQTEDATHANPVSSASRPGVPGHHTTTPQGLVGHANAPCD